RAVFGASNESEYYVDMVTDLVSLHTAVSRGCTEEALGGRVPEVEMFLRARLCLLSRVFQTCCDSTLVPVADLLNHANEPSVLWNWDAEGQAMVITAVKAHRRGEELFTSYGTRSNVLLYRTYGFTLPPMDEPAWTYIVRPHLVRPVYAVFIEDGDARPRMMLESSHIDESLCEILNDVMTRKHDASDFLRLVCARSSTLSLR
ncbi:unnamed protein product, partial [Polarella glacialis]